MGSDPNNSGSNDDQTPGRKNADHNRPDSKPDAPEGDSVELTVNADKTTSNEALTVKDTPTVGPEDITANLSATSAEAVLEDVTLPDSDNNLRGADFPDASGIAG